MEVRNESKRDLLRNFLLFPCKEKETMFCEDSTLGLRELCKHWGNEIILI